MLVLDCLGWVCGIVFFGWVWGVGVVGCGGVFGGLIGFGKVLLFVVWLLWVCLGGLVCFGFGFGSLVCCIVCGGLCVWWFWGGYGMLCF